MQMVWLIDIKSLSQKQRRFTYIYIKKTAGVYPGGPGPGSTRRVNRVSPGQLSSGFLPPSGPVPGPSRPTGPVRVLKLWLKPHIN